MRPAVKVIEPTPDLAEDVLSSYCALNGAQACEHRPAGSVSHFDDPDAFHLDEGDDEFGP